MMSNKMRYLIFYPPGRSVMSENFAKHYSLDKETKHDLNMILQLHNPSRLLHSSKLC